MIVGSRPKHIGVRQAQTFDIRYWHLADDLIASRKKPAPIQLTQLHAKIGGTRRGRGYCPDLPDTKKRKFYTNVSSG